MKIEWQQDLATGDEKIDRHHKELLAKVQQLVNACKEGREKTAVLQMLDYLANYVDSHFAAEERFLELFRVANTMQHLKQHADFRRSLDKLRADCVKEGVSLAVVTNSLKLTYLWLRDHIQQMDKTMIQAKLDVVVPRG